MLERSNRKREEKEMAVKKMQTMARQGDVLFVSENHKSLSPETRKRLFGNITGKKFDFKKEGRLPMAYGEVSGHCHGIYEKGVAELLVNQDVQETIKHLKVTGVATVRHEEHDTIELAKGSTAVLIQNEWRLNKVRRVMD